jgi:capsular polysaccharide biosynthesis protein
MTDVSSKRTPRGFKFILRIDPLRFIHGVREHWIWFLVLPIALGALGWIVGSVKVEDRYSVSLQLIRTGSNTTIQTTEMGQAFRPRDLSDDTLLSTTYSNEVLQRTAARVGPNRNAGHIFQMIEIAKQRNTSLFYLTAHSRVGPQDAVDVVTVWAEEIIRFTNNLQKEEAAQMEEFISEQLRSMDLQLNQVNQEILIFAKEENFVDSYTQTQASVQAYERMRVELAEVVVSLRVKEAQITRYKQELRDQNPLATDLKVKKEELSRLRGRYTDLNPLVQEKKYEIDSIEAQIEKVRNEVQSDDLKDYTGSYLGNNLYLEILDLQSEQETLQGRVDSLKVRIVEQAEEVSGMPEKSLRLNEMQGRRDLLVTAMTLLDSRRKEAAFYQTKAPGYWRIFQKPSVGDVTLTSQSLKAVALGFAGVAVGLSVAFVAAFIWELMQSGLRTPVEAAIATSTMPIMNYALSDPEVASKAYKTIYKNSEMGKNERAIRAFWLTQSIGAAGLGRRKRYLFANTEIRPEEENFWVQLLDVIEMEAHSVTFCNLDYKEGLTLDRVKAHTAVNDYYENISEFSEGYENETIIIRLNRMPSSLEVEFLRSIDALFLLNSPSIAERESTRATSELLCQLLGQPDGLLLLDSTHGKFLYRFINALEMTVLHNYFGFVAEGSSSD